MLLTLVKEGAIVLNRTERNSRLKSVKDFLKQHDRYHILRGTKRFLINTFHRLVDPWYHDRIHRNYSPDSKSEGIPYIIRRHQDNVGLFSYFITILGGIAYAEQKGYIPVVDMKNYPNTYLYDSEVGHVNSWEYYFTQPDTLTLEDALSCRKYIIGKDTEFHPRPSQSASAFYNEDGKLDYWRGMCRKYIHFTQPVLDGVDRELHKFAGKRVLGVMVRGTDYVALKPHGHPVQPTAEQAIIKTREVLSTGKYDTVYLVTEDKKIVAKFQEVFGDKLLLPKANYLNYDYDNPRYLADYHSDRKNDKYLRGLEYLVSMITLTKCSGLITSRTSGSTGIMCLSEGFEYLYVFDFGVYP